MADSPAEGNGATAGITPPPERSMNGPLEPYRGERFSFARPVGWQVMDGPNNGQDGREDKMFIYPEPARAGVGFIRLTAATVPWHTNSQANDRLEYVLRAGDQTAIRRQSCCTVSFSHWSMAIVDTGKTGYNRFLMVLANSNRLGFESTTAVESLIQVTAVSIEKLEEGALWIALNIAQSVGPPNSSTAALVHGTWESVQGDGTDFFDASGTFIAGNTHGEYRLYKFLPSRQYEITSAVAFQGPVTTNEAIVIDEAGRYSLDSGVLALTHQTCIGRQYKDGAMTFRGACGEGTSPWILRVEPHSNGAFQMTGVALNPAGWNRPQLIVPSRK